MSLPSIFRANDIRGVYGQDFDLSFCKKLAQGLSLLLTKHKAQCPPQILIGHDARLSSPEIAQELSEQLLAEGLDVCSIGIAPSPLCYFLIHHYNLSATIIVTASHNPPHYNGFKFLIHKKLNCPNPTKELKTIFENRLKPLSLPRGKRFEIDPFSPYIDSLKKEFSLKPLPFVVDTGNGALGPVAKKVFSALGLNPFYLCLEPDGRFPHHHPDPTIEKNLTLLKQKVLSSDSVLGVGFDGDGDRLVLVTREGRTVLGDELGFLLLPSLLKKNQNPSEKIIVADVKCSDWFFESIKKQGGHPVMAPSGHSLTRQALEKEKALLALEFSGHVFFNDRNHRGFDDALYACLRVLEVLKDKASPQLSQHLPQASWYQTGEIRKVLPQKKVLQILDKIKNHLNQNKETFNELDGIRFSRKTSWGLFRCSTTVEALTFRLEASTQNELDELKKEFYPFVGMDL